MATSTTRSSSVSGRLLAASASAPATRSGRRPPHPPPGHREDLGDVLGQAVEIDAHAAVGLDVAQRIVDGREHAQAEQVELDELHRLDVTLVVLDDDAPRHAGPLERRDVDQRRPGDEHAADVDAEVARETVDPSAQLEPALPGREADRAAARGCAGGTWFDSATLEWLGARSPPRPIACVGGAGGSQAYGRPRRSVRRRVAAGRLSRGRSRGRRSCPLRSVAGCRSVAGRRPAASARCAGESPGPPSSSEGLERRVVTGARRSGESTSGSATIDRPPTMRGRMSPIWVTARHVRRVAARVHGSPAAARRRTAVHLGPPAAPPGPTGRDARPPEPGPPARRVRGRAGPCRPPGHARRRPQRQRRCQEPAPGQRSQPSPPPGERKNSAKPPSASRSRRTMTES